MCFSGTNLNVDDVIFSHHIVIPFQFVHSILSLYVCVGVFVGLGLSGVVPTLHFVISEGLIKATTMGQMGWLLLMATLYITGACLYAARIPERFFPGKCDIWVSDTHAHKS